MEDIEEHSDNSQDFDFDWALISFALNPDRLYFIDRPASWLDFFSVNSENMNKYYHYTTDQLCRHFLNRVLVQINNYDLNEEELHILGLLNLNPSYRRTESGFVRIADLERIDFKRNTRETGSLIDGAAEDLSRQVMVVSRAEPHSKFQLSAENAALLSVVLSMDADLPSCERLTELEILKCLRGAKNMFQQTGRQLETLNISVDNLLGKLRTLTDLKNILRNLITKTFTQEEDANNKL